MRKFVAVIVAPLVILAGCGGGGSGTTTNPGGGGGGGGGGGTQVIATPGPPNVETLVVDQGPTALTTPAVNTSFVTVTVCIPSTSTCQTIDHIEVDTGSSGLRILADATTTNPVGSFNLALPPVLDPNNPSNHLAECLQFADGFSWGSVNYADIRLPVSGKTATNVIVQVIGAVSAGSPSTAKPTCLPPPPINANGCLGLENTVSCFGANGILGVGPFVNDCDSVGPCVNPGTITNGGVTFPANSAAYFTCTAAASCALVTSAQQLQNPVTLFAADNNGVIIELPAVVANGLPAPLNGSLVFGIGTQSNNALGSATTLPMCNGSGSSCMIGNNPATPLFGTVTATLNGTMYIQSYLDSGSNANFFPTTSIPSCSAPNDGFLCPTSTTNVSATLTGTDGTTASANFSVANADSLFQQNNAMNFVFSNLAGSNYAANVPFPNTTVDLGLSFFYGHNVFTGFENNSNGPYFAY